MIPKYIIDILDRSKFEFDSCTNNENYAPGYTIRITKATPYTKIDTFKAEIKRFCDWANRNTYKGCMDTAHLLNIPNKTHYCNQYAIVTIYDPIMKLIENYIK